MKNLAFLFSIAAGFAFGQYKMEPAAAAPAELPAAYASVVQSPGVRVLAPGGAVYCELWLGKTLPSGPKNTEENVSLPTIPHGALLGVIRFASNAQDRRGQSLKAGWYTLRYSLYPVTGDHVGVAPQRDFAVLTPIADDKTPAALPKYDELMNMSRKASGTPHPAVLSIYPASGTVPSIAKEGDHDWVGSFKIGDQNISIILVGKAEG